MSRKQGASEAERVARLTQTELRVVRLLSFGLSSREVADRLGVSPNTARTHAQNILVKLHVHSQAGAVGMVCRVRSGESPLAPLPYSSPSSAPLASPVSSSQQPHTWKDDWTKLRHHADDWVRMAASVVGRGRHVGP